MNRTIRGRPLLNLVVREFDLDAALAGVVSAVIVTSKSRTRIGFARSFQRQGSSHLRTIAD
jgi:hypothetical protein